MRWLAALVLLFAQVAWADLPNRRTEGWETQLNKLISTLPVTLNLDASTANLETQPLAHYLCEDAAASVTVTDKSGNYTGSATRNTNTAFGTASGKVNRGFDFYAGSVDDRIDTGADTLGTGADTFCLWMYPHSGGESGNGGRIFDNGNSQSALNNTDKAINCIRDGSGQGWSAPDLWAVNTWVHTCIVMYSNGYCDFYRNGELHNAADNLSGTPVAGSGNLLIGNNAASDRAFDGLMDDIRIYNRALTPSEITGLYNSGTGHQYQAASKSSSTITVDGSGNVASWQGSSIEFYQSTAGSRPSLTMIGGRRRLLFDATDDRLEIGAGLLNLSTVVTNNAGTFIVAYHPTSWPGVTKLGLQLGGYLSTYTYVGPNGMGCYSYDGSATWHAQINTSGTTPHILSCRYDGRSMRVGLDGTHNVHEETGKISLTTNNWYINGNFHDAAWGQVLVFNKVLTTPDLMALERGLAKKWSTPLGATSEPGCDAYLRSLGLTADLKYNDMSTVNLDGSNNVRGWWNRLSPEENLITYSQSFDTSSSGWARLNIYGVTADAAVAPDGTTTADKLIPDTTNGGHRLLNSYSLGATTTTPLTFSVYIKNAGYNFAQFEANWTSGGRGAPVDLTTCTVGSEYTWGGPQTSVVAPACVSAGNGWCKCSQTDQYGTATGLNVDVRACSTIADCVTGFAGDNSKGIYVWGGQVRNTYGSPDTYYTTTSAGKDNIGFWQATAADQPLWTNTGIDFDHANSECLVSTNTSDDVFNNNAKSWYFVYDWDGDTSTSRRLFIDSSSYILFNGSTASSQSQWSNDDGGGLDVLTIAGLVADTLYIADGSHATNINMALNGVTQTPVASGSTAAMTGTLSIGGSSACGNSLDGKIRRIILDDAEHSSDTRARIRSCLGSEYGVTF